MLEPTDDEYISGLLERFRSPDQQERRHAIRALARLGRRAVPALLEVLRQDDLIRRYAVAVFAERPDARAVPLLCQALIDVDWEVRREAARALKVAAPAEAADALLPLLLPTEGHPQVRLLALEALTAIRDRNGERKVPGEVWERAIPRLCTILASDERRLHGTAAELLGKLRAPDGIDALWAALGDAELDVAFFITRALGQIGGARVVEPLRVALSHREPGVRAAAVEALGQVGGDEALMLLTWVLRTRDLELQRTAAVAIERLALAQPTPALRAVLAPLERALKARSLLLSREDFRLFSRVLRQVEFATQAFRDLPVPALPGSSAAQLPVPAPNADTSLPAPSVLEESGALRLPWWRQTPRWRWRL